MAMNLISDTTCERSILAYIMSSESLSTVREFLSPESFTLLSYKDVYVSVTELADRGEHYDVYSLSKYLSEKGSFVTTEELVEIAITPYLPNVEYLALRLQELEERRKLILMTHEWAELSQNEQESMSSLRERFRNYLEQTDERSKVVDLGTAFQDLSDHISNNGKENLGTKTGFIKIDRHGGFHKGNFIVIGGGTSHGKTSLALSMAMNAIFDNKKIAYYSLEMTRVELAARLVSMKSGVSATRLLYAQPTAVEWEKIDRTFGLYPKGNLFFDDKATSNLETILNSIRSITKKYDIDGVIIDYLQILTINAGGDSQEQSMAYAARRLKNLASELQIWIMALSQVNRDGARENQQPTLSRLRNSGQIAEAADIVILVYRPQVHGLEKYNESMFSTINTQGTALIDVAKGRNIGIFKFICGFNPSLTLFYDDPKLLEQNKSEENEENYHKLINDSNLPDLPY